MTILALVILSAAPLLAAPATAFANDNEHDSVKLCHITGAGWHALTVDDDAVNGHLGHGDFLYSGHDTFNDAWCTNHVPVTTAAVTATKIVCDSESDLPNWGNGSGPDITATTASTFLASHPNCHPQTGWTFEYVKDSVSNTNPGNNLASGGGSWAALGTTDGTGSVTANVTAPTGSNKKVWFREDMQSGYVPFSGSASNVSAEMYCSTDHLNYDNWDWVSPLTAGNHYYCVAWNVQQKGTLTIVKNTIGGNGEFTFNVTGQNPVNVETVDGSGSQTLTLPLGSYDVTENVPEGWDLTPLTEGSCVYENQSVGNVIQNGKNITIEDDGDDVTCTFTNTLDHGSLTVIKHVVGGQKTASNFSFTVDTTGPDVSIANGSEDGVQKDIPNGAYAVSETQANADNYVTTYDQGCTGEMEPGAQNVCVVTNTYVPPAPQCDLNASHTVVSGTDATFSGTDGSGSAVAVTMTDVTSGAWTTIPGATWIWSSAEIADGTVDNTETFTQNFTIVGTPNANALLTIAADNYYSVSINGHDIDLGAGMLSDNNFSSAATYNVPMADLVTGANTITVVGKNKGVADLSAHNNPAGVAYSITYYANECDTGTTCVPGVNLLQNPSFEANAISAGSWDIFPSGNVALAWLVSWLNPSGAPTTANAEIQSNGLLGVTASNGSQWTELDSDWDGPSGSLSGEAGAVSLAQTIATVPGKTYQVSFDFMPRPDTDGSESKVEALHGATIGSTVDASAGAGWTNHSYTFVASGASETISFRDAGANNNSVGTLLDNTSVTCQADEETPTTATIIAKKVVCNTEANLPNWGEGAANITATTAQDYVDASDGACHLEDWTFEYAPNGTGNPGDNTPSGGAGWTSFAAGVATPVSAGHLIWVREQVDADYVPFSGATSDLESEAAQNSAELYCNTDVLNYDNYDWIDPVVAGQTYYCVGFNAPVDNGGGDDTSHSDLSVVKTVTKLVGENQVSVEGQGVDVGTTLTYTVTVHNDGPDAATNVAVDDVLPSGVTVVGSPLASQGTYDGSTWTVGTLADDGSATLTVVVTVNSDTEGTSIVNEASIGDSDSADSNDENDSDSVSITVNGDGDNNNGGGGDTPPQQKILGGGPIGGGGGIGGGNGQVLGASCGLYMGQHLRFGSNKNSKEQVSKLQTFLNEQGFGPLPVTGFFGPLTEAAVKAFQQTYADQILTPWNLNAPTGLVYLLTLWKINHIECPDLIDDLPSSLVPWSANPNAQ